MDLNIYELMHWFWRLSEEEPFSPTEAALYGFLLERANLRMWQMPIRCPTEFIRAHIKTTKQSLVAARENLQRRGLIQFTPGSCRDISPLYSLNPPPNKLSSDLSGDLSGKLSSELSSDLSQYNIKDIRQRDNFQINAREEMSLEELETMFLSDEQWLQSVLSLLSTQHISDVGIEKLREELSLFFIQRRASGDTTRIMSDCKSHFVNWLVKKKSTTNKNNKYGTNQFENHDYRRGCEAIPASAAEYEGDF